MSDQVFIAAISAGGVLLGVLLSQIIALLTAHQNRKFDRQILLRQKFEKLVEDLNDAMRRIAYLNLNSNQEDIMNCVVLLRNVYSLSLIYFPKILPPSSKLLSTTIKFHDVHKLSEQEKEDLKLEFLTHKHNLERSIAKYAYKYT